MFIVEGKKMVEEARKSGWKIETIVLREGVELSTSDAESRALVAIAESRDFEKLSLHVNPDGMLAVIHLPAKAKEAGFPGELLPPGPGFLLESIRDPGNLGTIIRTADWFGFRRIYCSPDTVDVFNPKVLRSSMGAIFRVELIYADPWEALLRSNAPAILATDLAGDSLVGASLPDHPWILIGNESQGLSASSLAIPGIQKLRIPGGGGAESLNAAAAAAILGWEVARDDNRTM